jgi:hypothetical protein
MVSNRDFNLQLSKSSQLTNFHFVENNLDTYQEQLAGLSIKPRLIYRYKLESSILQQINAR